MKSKFGADRLVVLGYSNDVMAYIPSRRVQREGGYKANDSLVTGEVEDTILNTARRVLSAPE